MTVVALLLRSWLGSAWDFLKGASAWQILCLAMGALLIVQHFQLVSARHSAARWEKQASGLQQQLNSISTNKNVQHEVTTRTVARVIQGQKQVQTIVRVIHDAPNPPDCKTPAIDRLRSAV